MKTITVEYAPLFKRVLLRGGRMFIGAFAAFMVVQAFGEEGVSTFKEFATYLESGTLAGVAAVFMGLEKWARG